MRRGVRWRGKAKQLDGGGGDGRERVERKTKENYVKEEKGGKGK